MMNVEKKANDVKEVTGAKKGSSEDEACVSLSKPHASDQELLGNVFAGLNVYFNYTGNSKCLDLGDEDDIGAGMWTYQSCTEMVMPFCYDGQNDMFEAQAWDM